MSISLCGPVTPPTSTFCNISFTETIRNSHVVSKITEKGCKNLYLLSKVFHRSSKSNSYLMSISRRGPVNQLTPSVGNISVTEAILFVAWKFNQKPTHRTY